MSVNPEGLTPSGLPPTVEPMGQTQPAASTLSNEDVIRDAVAEMRRAVMADVSTQIAETLRGLSRPNVAARPNLAPATEPVAPAQITDMREYLYRGMPPAVRAIRNPKTDGLMAEWVRGVRFRDHERARRAERELYEALGERALLVGVGVPLDGSGGPLIPLPLANLIILARDRVSKIRPRAQRFTSAATQIRIPTSSVVTTAMVAEGASATPNDPTVTVTTLAKKKMQSRFQVSDEMLADSAFNLVSFYSERAGSAMGQYEDQQFSTLGDGTGANITESLASATIAAWTLGLAATLTLEDIIGIYFTLPEQYLTGAYFMGNGQMMQFLTQVLDGNGRPIFTPGLGVPMPVGDENRAPGGVGTVFGRPVVSIPLANGHLIFGSLEHYGVLDGGALEMRVSEHVAWATDLVDYKVTARVDGAVLLEDAFREITGVTAVG